MTATEIYDEVEYISSTSGGGQYIRLNKVTPLWRYNSRNVNFDVEAKFKQDSLGIVISAAASGDARNYFGIEVGSDSYNHVGIYSNSSFGYERDVLGNFGEIITLNHLKNTESYRVCATSTYPGSSNDNYTYPLVLFARSTDTLTAYCVATLYYIKVWWPQGTLVYDCIPAKSSSGSVGLYNKVDGTFLTSLQNAFVAGPTVVITPVEPE